MQTKSKTPETEAIQRVFRDLGLENAEMREHLQQLAKPINYRSWNEKPHESQSTRNHTAYQNNDNHA